MNKRIIGILGGLVVGGFGLYEVMKNKAPIKYSSEWIKNLSDSDWENEREIIRQKFCNPKFDENVRIGFKKLLDLFDKIKSDRDWAGKVPQGPGYHREHGYNLYKD